MDLELQNYVVVFLDLLGQKERILELEELPRTQQEEEEAFSVLRDTWGVVEDIRGMFINFVEKHQRIEVACEEGYSEELRALSSIPLDILTYGFADSFVLAVPLGSPDTPHQTLVSIRAVLSATASMMIDSLSKGRVLRGGIDFGPCLKVGESEIYGTGLVRPYVLESKCAKHPRVLVGSPLVSFLTDTIGVEKGSPSEELAKSTAVRCLNGIRGVEDSRHLLDYLGTGCLSEEGRETARASVALAYSQLCELRDLYMSSERQDLVEKYNPAIEYFESNRERWGF